MEANYSSTPETRNPLKIVLIVSLTALLLGAAIWWSNQKNKRKNESSIIR
jgi:hypothetical protein